MREQVGGERDHEQEGGHAEGGINFLTFEWMAGDPIRRSATGPVEYIPIQRWAIRECTRMIPEHCRADLENPISPRDRGKWHYDAKRGYYVWQSESRCGKR